LHITFKAINFFPYNFAKWLLNNTSINITLHVKPNGQHVLGQQKWPKRPSIRLKNLHHQYLENQVHRAMVTTKYK